jgi:gamma-glutamyltranspeptidase
MPSRAACVDVPGVVGAAVGLRPGTIDLATALAPAIAFARRLPRRELMANEWQDQKPAGRRCGDGGDVLPKGAPPKLGEVFANPRLAKSLEAIAKKGATRSTPDRSRGDRRRHQSAQGFARARDFADHK